MEEKGKGGYGGRNKGKEGKGIGKRRKWLGKRERRKSEGKAEKT